MYKKCSLISNNFIYFFSISIISLLIACSNEGDLIKRSIIENIPASLNKKITIDLNMFSKKKITKICIQNTYMTEDSLSKLSGEKIKNFTGIDDNDHYFFLWVFYKNKEPIKIKFYKVKDIDIRDNTEVCTSSSTVILINSELSVKSLER